MAKAKKTFEDILSCSNYVTKDNVDHVEKALLAVLEVSSFMLYPENNHDLIIVGIKKNQSRRLSSCLELTLLCNDQVVYLPKHVKDMIYVSPIEFSSPGWNSLSIEDVAYYLKMDATDLKIVVINRIIDAVLSPYGCRFGLESQIFKFNSFEELMVQGDLKC